MRKIFKLHDETYLVLAQVTAVTKMDEPDEEGMTWEVYTSDSEEHSWHTTDAVARRLLEVLEAG